MINIPRSRFELIQVRRDLERLGTLLESEEKYYKSEIARNSKIPWWVRATDLFVNIISLGNAELPDREKELKRRIELIHEKYGRRQSKIQFERFLLFRDIEKLEEIEKQYVIDLVPSFSKDGYPLNWIELAAEVKRRDGYRCSECGRIDMILDVHHHSCPKTLFC